MEQLQEFVATAGTALHTVKTLAVGVYKKGKSNDSPGLEKHLAAAFGPLSEACPMVQLLQISGAITLPLLAVFGRAFPCVTSLEAATIPLPTLLQTPILLPSITSTCILATKGGFEYGRQSSPIGQYLLAISALRTLVRVDFRGWFLTGDDWGLLPAGLQSLTCSPQGMLLVRFPELSPELEEPTDSLANPGPPAGLTLPNLTEFIYYSYQGMSLIMQANLLRAAPKLQRLQGVCKIKLACDTTEIPNLVLVHERLAAGLVFCLHRKTGEYVKLKDGVLLAFTGHWVPELAAAFWALFPTLERFSNIQMDRAEPVILTSLATAFPSMQRLCIRWHVEEGSLPCLAASLALHHLIILCVMQSYSLELEALCMQVPTLRCVEAKEMPYADQKSLAAGLRARGSRTQVVHNNEEVV